MKLNKTDFLIYRACAHNAWVKLHRPEIYRAQPLSAFERNIIETGNAVDDLARGMFAGGITVARDAFELRVLYKEHIECLLEVSELAPAVAG
jgi:hypothetical protein